MPVVGDDQGGAERFGAQEDPRCECAKWSGCGATTRLACTLLEDFSAYVRGRRAAVSCPHRSERSEAATIMGEVNFDEGVPEGEERWRDEGGSGESTHFHPHGWQPDPAAAAAGPEDDADANGD